MGNIFRKETPPALDSDDEGSIYTVGGRRFTPLSKVSLDDYSDEDLSDLSTSSITKPTVFNSQDSAESSKHPKSQEIESPVINAEQLDSIYERYKATYPEITEKMFMPPEVLSTVKYLFERWQTDMIYNFDSYITYAKLDKNMIKMFGDSVKDSANCNIENMFLRHSVGMIITYKMILDGLEQNKADELIEQLAISHGLHGINGGDFKVLDLHFTRYLLQRNLINDDSIIAIVAFLFIVSDRISNVLVHRRSRAQSSITSEIPVVGRTSITRDNYRCMKKWAMVTPIIHSRIDFIQKQIRIHRPQDKFELDSGTISTNRLKASDVFMNFLQKKKSVKE